MLQNIKDLYGSRLDAIDGEIGSVKDFYFDDQNWVIRYLVVDTGSWLTGRLVLLTPHVFGRWDRIEKALPVKLRKKQIEDSPSIESHRPVSRQYEAEYYRYYGWPAYWSGDAMWGLSGNPEILLAPAGEISGQKLHHRDDKHLQSTQAISGYAIQAIDGAIGHMSGFLVDNRNWAIRELVVEAGHWYAGKAILIAPGNVERISYEESKVFVNLTKADIQRAAENTLATTGASKI